jgi:hypothetical protein
MCGFLLGGNAHLLHFSWRETRMCCISPGEKVACVAFLLGKNRMLFGVASLAMIIPRFLDFSRGKIRYVWISPGEKCAHVAFLPGRKFNAHVLHFSRGEIACCLELPRCL